MALVRFRNAHTDGFEPPQPLGGLTKCSCLAARGHAGHKTVLQAQPMQWPKAGAWAILIWPGFLIRGSNSSLCASELTRRLSGVPGEREEAEPHCFSSASG